MTDFSNWIETLSKISTGVAGEKIPIIIAAGTTEYTETGATANDIVAGDDSRLSDARTPTAHASTHATGQSDAIAPADIGAATSAQGALADSALQPTDIASSTITAAVGAVSFIFDGTGTYPPTDVTTLSDASAFESGDKLYCWEAGAGLRKIDYDDLPGVGSGAPSDATYIVQTANGTLTNEQVLGALSTGLLKVTTTTGVLSSAVADTDYIAIVNGRAQIGANIVAEQPVSTNPGTSITVPDAAVGKRCRYVFTSNPGAITVNPPSTAPASGYSAVIIVEIAKSGSTGGALSYSVSGATLAGEAIAGAVPNDESRFLAFEYVDGTWYYQGRINGGDVVVSGGTEDNVVTIAADGSLQDSGSALGGSTPTDFRMSVPVEDSNASRAMNVTNDFGGTVKQHALLRLSNAGAQYDVVKNIISVGMTVTVRWTNATPSQSTPFTNSGGGVSFVPSTLPAIDTQHQTLQLVCVDDTTDANVFHILPATLA